MLPRISSQARVSSRRSHCLPIRPSARSVMAQVSTSRKTVRA